MEKNVRRLKAKSKKLNKNEKHLRKKLDYTCQGLDYTCQKLDQTRKHLVNSQKEYTAMKKKLKQVHEDLIAAQAQLNERSMLSTSQKQKKLIERELAQRERDQLLTKIASTGLVTWQQGCQKGTGQSTQYMVT